ncbi:MAG: tetratricopeptide repeat protein [Verrucomicrobiae bacterium]|nr:tetratricopeptide repeat protein [Verrucomicrobiae bacterium]
MVGKRLPGLGAGTAVLLTLIAHLPALWNDFVWWDDPTHVTQNPVIRALTWENLQAMFTQPIAKLYCPLTWLSFALDYQLWGRNPVGYHLTNLVLHAANVALVFALAHRLLAAERIWPAFFTAALFGVHPLRVESVAWVTERKDVLFTFFYLLALWAWTRQARLPVVWTLFLAAALSKPTAVTFPVVLWLLSRWLGRPVTAVQVAPFLVVSLVIGTVTVLAQATGPEQTIATAAAIPWHVRPALVGYCALFYVGKFLWPFALRPIYPTFDELHWSPVAYATAFIALTVLCFVLRQKQPSLWRGWLFYLVTLSPTIGILPVGIHVVADRYSYLAILGLCLPLGSVGGQWRVARGVLVVVVPALMYLTALQTTVWRNTETLFRTVLDHDPTNLPALINLTKWYTAHGDLDTAIALGQRAVTVAPNSDFARLNLAVALQRAGRLDEALKVWPPLANESSPNGSR